MSALKTFLLMSLFLPFSVALASYIIKGTNWRRILVVTMSLILGLAAYWLYAKVPLTPVFISFHGWEKAVTFLDILLLFYILYVGIENRHLPIGLLAILQLALVAYVEGFLGPDSRAVGTFAVDRLSVVMFFVVSVVGSLISVYALPYMEEHVEHVELDRNQRFFFWFVLFLAVMNGLIFANNVLWLYFFWEATTLCSFQLIGHDDTEEARRNSLHALYLNSVGGLAMITGITVMLAGFTGRTLSLADIAASDLGLVSPVFLLALALFMTAAFTKSAQFPFQNWLLGAMVAPTPVSALLHSSTMVKAGVYLAVRLAPAYDGTALATFIALIGAFSFFAASLMAAGNDNAKAVLAYSTVANLGLIFACCGIDLPLSVAAAVLLIIFHALAKGLLFMGAGVIEHRLGSRNIESMEGLGEKLPLLALLMVGGGFAMFLPPFGMLFSKWAAMASAATSPLVLLLFVAGSALTTVFWSKWMGRILAASPGRVAKRATTHVSSRGAGYYAVSLGILGLATLVLSFDVTTVIDRLVAPALVWFYPLAFQPALGGNVILFSWASFLHPNLAITGLPEGVFPFGLMGGALVATLVLPWLLFRPEFQAASSVYLCGENMPGEENRCFVSSMEKGTEVALAGYYFTGFINEGLLRRLSWIGGAILILMLGVIVLWVLW
ncbi:MAG: NADH-quinone oxidoreductase subunit L [Syntrophothermus sp.]|uniref:NADH-quinone oxidoreductase subunit 5 family protein n=1 Tax=Syntrophothermus sp. TaxID=2736299 RepID=UPI00257A4C73|nr:proton-conducting transporter membrane subunit [Syntrophothermus sp.]NSW82186.1 NADH-quinone oxidoreductase subunit L [Syntrophothermus sp.]